MPDPAADGFAEADRRARSTPSTGADSRTSAPELAVELLHWRLTASGAHARDATEVAPAREVTARAAEATRQVWFDRGFLTTRVLPANAIGVGDLVAGPAVVQAPTTTILLGPGDVLRADGEAFVIDAG